MNEKVTENTSSVNLKKWNPNREGLIYKEFIETWKQGAYEVTNKLINDVTEQTASILSKCIDPKKISGSKNSETGLVIGQVQSGKTLSITSVSAMAKDNGFGIVIVMSGAVSTLSSQTADRLEQELEGRKTIKIKNNPREVWKFNEHLMTAKNVIENFINTKDPEDRLTLLVLTHKNPSRISHITELFNNLGDLKNKIPTLIIDDEADHHSLNSREFLNDIENLTERRRNRLREIYQIQEGDNWESIADAHSQTVEELQRINDMEDLPRVGQYILTEYISTTTHTTINELREVFPFHTYLGYTATPQANSLIPSINSLSPTFAHVISPGENYTGLNHFFPKDSRRNIHINSRHIETIEDNFADLIVEGIPPSLETAIKYFIFGVACGILNKEHNNKKKNRSMIIHPHSEVDTHSQFYNFTAHILSSLRSSLENKNDASYPETIKHLKITYNDFVGKTEGKNFPKFDDEFIDLIKRAIDQIKPRVKKFNAEDGRIDHQNWKDAYARILIGGVGLERGYTVKGLSVTYLSRNRSRQDDTMLQRARFFGYHKKHQDFTRVFISRDAQNYYQEICELNNNFLNSIKEWEKTGKRFSEWPRHWFGTNAARHELSRPGIMRGSHTQRFRGTKPFTNKYSHLLDLEQLNNNRKIYNDLWIKVRSDGKLKHINQLEELNPAHKNWSRDRHIQITSELSIKEFYENYFKYLKFFDYEKTDFEVVGCNLAGLANSFGDEKIPILFMYIDDSNKENTRRSMQKNDSIQPYIGRDRSNLQGFPGDRVLHYDYLVGNSREAIGTENLTIKVNMYNEIRNIDKKTIFKKDVPYFHFIPSSRMWKDYIRQVRTI